MKPSALKQSKRSKASIALEAELEAVRKALRDDDGGYSIARSALMDRYLKGMGKDVEPALVRDAIVEAPPTLYHLAKMVKKCGAAYDAAIIEGAEAYRRAHGLEWAMELQLVAALSKHAGLSIAESIKRLLRAEEAVDRSVHSNAPDRVTPALIENVCAAMAPWFDPLVIDATLELAAAVPPSRGSDGDRTWINPPQCDEEWALLIACAHHADPRARALVDQRAPLASELEEPVRVAFVAAIARSG
ncbi:MAG: hypothetical protein JNK05_36655 [Myxococcales bacterium]|nr:hypothetical protein [Myxococcales bacterium]